jgi:hypothetical protein
MPNKIREATKNKARQPQLNTQEYLHLKQFYHKKESELQITLARMKLITTATR